MPHVADNLYAGCKKEQVNPTPLDCMGLSSSDFSQEEYARSSSKAHALYERELRTVKESEWRAFDVRSHFHYTGKRSTKARRKFMIAQMYKIPSVRVVDVIKTKEGNKINTTFVNCLYETRGVSIVSATIDHKGNMDNSTYGVFITRHCIQRVIERQGATSITTAVRLLRASINQAICLIGAYDYNLDAIPNGSLVALTVDNETAYVPYEVNNMGVTLKSYILNPSETMLDEMEITVVRTQGGCGELPPHHPLASAICN